MLDDLEPDELAKWQALALVDGWGEEWRMVGVLCATIHNAALRIVSAIPMCAAPVKRSEIKTERDFMPKHTRQITTPQKADDSQQPMSTDDMAKRLAGWR
jgi:hypothetical protein